jgi:hypothetical protein
VSLAWKLRPRGIAKLIDLGLDYVQVPDEYHGRCQELISPVIAFDNQGSWHSPIRNAFEAIHQTCHLVITKQTGLHVHISPQLPNTWDLQKLKRVSKAVIYFENAFQSLLPPFRRASRFAQRNFADSGANWENIDMKRFFEEIDGCNEGRQIAPLMNNNGSRRPSRDFAWNFDNISIRGDSSSPAVNTVEFRSPPGATTADQVLAWVELAVVFVAWAAERFDEGSMEPVSDPTEVTVQQLKRFVDEGANSGTTSGLCYPKLFEERYEEAPASPRMSS